MRILVLGAGAIGGYFGGRLLAAGKDVTFLVRPERARLLTERGLSIHSESGNLKLAKVPTIISGEVTTPFDLVIVTCKSYDLDTAMEAIAPAVGTGTIVLPLLNGMRHLERLAGRFPQAAVLGGTCFISTRVEPDGSIHHLSDVHILAFGSRGPEQQPAVERVATVFNQTGFEVRLSENIVQEMWEKWIFIASMAGMNCLMRSTIGDVIAAGGADFAKGLLDECSQIAATSGYAPRPAAYQFALERLTTAGSPIAASMLGDVERNGPTEADQILHDLLIRRPAMLTPDFSLLRLAWLNLETYRCRQERLSGSSGTR